MTDSKGICTRDDRDVVVTIKLKDDMVKFLLPFMLKAYVNEVLQHSFLFIRMTDDVNKHVNLFWNKHQGVVCWITNIKI